MGKMKNKNTENQSVSDNFSKNLINNQLAPDMKIAAEAVKRARLVQNKLSRKEDTYVYEKIF
jgi:uncharacterized protein (UPF0218 family)